jgi:2-amino-1-hydroxyethylphosphonate dioxygenase (glycine-forming)
MSLSIQNIVDKIFYYYDTYGQGDYIGEPVTQIEHMTQGAMFAEQEGKSPEIILTMFLHDIGHLLLDDSNLEKMGDLGIQNHESKGRKFLEELGIPYPIPNLVENHVITKRYLVSKYPEYYVKLSDASKQTLVYQGGKMTEEELEKFEKDPLFEDSLLVRSYDERSKVENMKINSLDYYRGFLSAYLLLQGK